VCVWVWVWGSDLSRRFRLEQRALAGFRRRVSVDRAVVSVGQPRSSAFSSRRARDCGNGLVIEVHVNGVDGASGSPSGNDSDGHSPQRSIFWTRL
jgi:hypothetical protein